MHWRPLPHAHCRRYLVWGAFIFFLLTVGYIAFKRTPAFVRAPIYSLLHVKASGLPITHADYAGLSHPGMYPTPAAASGGSSGQGAVQAPQWLAEAKEVLRTFWVGLFGKPEPAKPDDWFSEVRGLAE